MIARRLATSRCTACRHLGSAIYQVCGVGRAVLREPLLWLRVAFLAVLVLPPMVVLCVIAGAAGLLDGADRDSRPGAPRR